MSNIENFLEAAATFTALQEAKKDDKEKEDEKKDRKGRVGNPWHHGGGKAYANKPPHTKGGGGAGQFGTSDKGGSWSLSRSNKGPKSKQDKRGEKTGKADAGCGRFARTMGGDHTCYDNKEKKSGKKMRLDVLKGDG